MWIHGGKCGDSCARNDAWSSTDGVTWTLVNSTAFEAATWGHAAVVFNTRLYLLGG